jgi:hypothetical protein
MYSNRSAVSVQRPHLAPDAAASDDGVHLFLADTYASHSLQSSGLQPGVQGAGPGRVSADRRVGLGLKRMGAAAPAARDTVPALQFVPVELPRPEPVLACVAAAHDIRIELQRGGLHVKLQCAASAGALYAKQLRALADALCAA